MEHYLSEGWDWANTLTAGPDTVAQLNDDIDDGLITAFATDAERPSPFFAFGTAATTPVEAPFSGLREEEADARTFGVGWRLSPTLGVALVQGRDATAFRQRAAGAVEGARSEVRTAGLALVQELGGWTLEAGAQWWDEELARRRYDSFTATAARGGTEVRGRQLRARLSGSFALGGAWLRPFAAVTVGERRVDGYAMADPYVGTVRFGAVRLAERTVEVGARLAVPLLPREDGGLWATASARLLADLGDHEVVVRITQGRLSRRERVRLPDRSTLRAGMGLRYASGDLTAGIAWDFTATEDGRDHRVGLDLTWHFPVR